jgi:anaerobic carbon-monoxide dehydrogenase iron sulfur subunit
MNAAFAFEQEKCTECERCMCACSVEKTGVVRLGASRIVIGRQWPEVPSIRVCRFDDCAGHPCVAACPVEAISEDGSLVLIDADTCTGCGACVDACPYQAIAMHGEVAVKCDFCAGDPACVKACVTAAITRKGV